MVSRFSQIPYVRAVFFSFYLLLLFMNEFRTKIKSWTKNWKRKLCGACSFIGIETAYTRTTPVCVPLSLLCVSVRLHLQYGKFERPKRGPDAHTHKLAHFLPSAICYTARCGNSSMFSTSFFWWALYVRLGRRRQRWRDPCHLWMNTILPRWRSQPIQYWLTYI